MDKSIEHVAAGIIHNAKWAATKTEWQIAIEQRLDVLVMQNNLLSAQVTQLQAELTMQAEACSHCR